MTCTECSSIGWKSSTRAACEICTTNCCTSAGVVLPAPCCSPCCTRCSQTSICTCCSAKSSYFARAKTGDCSSLPRKFGSCSVLSWLASADRCCWKVCRSHGDGCPPSMRSGPSSCASCTSIRMTEPMWGADAAPCSTLNVACSCACSIGCAISGSSVSSLGSGGSSGAASAPVAMSVRQESRPSCGAQAASGSTMCSPPSTSSEASGARGGGAAPGAPCSTLKLGPVPWSMAANVSLIFCRSRASAVEATPASMNSL
mmetsp:Transcript_49287/g.163228  ORF Transcript_49287/g.163228 Transcript_49287/m.163228 type:complete len:258 (-) Transcript_49287:99-872(-)